MNSLRFRLAAAMLLVFVTLLPALAADRAVTILHTNDIHSHILPFDSKSKGENVGGVVRRAALVRKIKSAAPYALYLDAGDIFQGTPFYSVFKGEACHLLAVAAGIEATTIGNHELDNGIDNLKKQIANSGIRILCCNVYDRSSGRLVFPAYHVFVRNGVKIAVIGSIGDEAWLDADRKYREPMECRDRNSEVRKVARRIRPYVDLIVVLSHAGIEFDEKLAAEVGEIDVVVGGHTHVELTQPKLVANNPGVGACHNGLGGTLVVQAGEHGVFLGRLDLMINEAGYISTYSGSLEKITSAHEPAADDPVQRLVDSYNERLDASMRVVAGHTDHELSLPKDKKKTHILPMGTFTAQSMLEAGKADICLVNSGAIRAAIPAGDITVGQIYEALPYDNTVVTFMMPGVAVQAMFDHICTNYGSLDGYQYAGFSADFDVKTGRASNLLIGGQPLDPAKTYRVSTSSFIANGNLEGDKMFVGSLGSDDSGVLMREAALAYLERVKNLPDFSQPLVNLIGLETVKRESKYYN
ncbi:MAG: bifunctional metallophosphatase/5'-nucleotidase [Candidatus Riflebacteria bacterium]|nr:bifunctional metallophosphatase/5'-nucleotidase [Candidatus Riflebacteria bacterium]